MKLSDITIRNGLTVGKHADGGGLYLEVTKAGSRYWRAKYRFGGVEKKLAFGVYPDVSLKAAREKLRASKAMLAEGEDPGAVLKKAKARIKEKVAFEADSTFQIVALEWLAKTAGRREQVTQNAIKAFLDHDILPYIGKMHVASIKPRDILRKVIDRIEERGSITTARRCLQICGKVFRYAVVTERAERDPSTDLSDAISSQKTHHHPAIVDPKGVGALLRSIDAHAGHPSVRFALKLLTLTFVRPGELRAAEWAEIDFDAAEWRIPAKRMKMRVGHIVPLSRQAIAAFKSMELLSEGKRYVFPNSRTSGKCMCATAINKALHRMGYGDAHTGHGFRAMARTILDEVLEERVDLIEHQLAHLVKDANGRAYNRTAHLPQRREMMQRWADYLDQLRIGEDEVTPSLIAGRTLRTLVGGRRHLVVRRRRFTT
ncbi:integrase arm-type DNA-binding domain-containing protein [Variovorax paradoxus]|nr:integrase arm-type DNA-binding domain-containing protein [Variovorax paradoxus]